MQCDLISMNGRKSRQFSQRNSLFLGCSLYMRSSYEHSLILSYNCVVCMPFIGVGITPFPFCSIFVILGSGCSHFLCVLLRLFSCILSRRLLLFLPNAACWTRLNLTLSFTDCMEIPEHSSISLLGLRITTTLYPSFLDWDNCSVFNLCIVLSWLLALRPCICFKWRCFCSIFRQERADVEPDEVGVQSSPRLDGAFPETQRERKGSFLLPTQQILSMPINHYTAETNTYIHTPSPSFIFSNIFPIFLPSLSEHNHNTSNVIHANNLN